VPADVEWLPKAKALHPRWLPLPKEPAAELAERARLAKPAQRPFAEALDKKDLREFLMGRLSLKMGASSHEMAEWYAEHRTRKGPPPPDPALLKAAVEAAARELHAEGKLQATPGPDGLYLLWK
jgi:hypothetical protein